MRLRSIPFQFVALLAFVVSFSSAHAELMAVFNDGKKFDSYAVFHDSPAKKVIFRKCKPQAVACDHSTAKEDIDEQKDMDYLRWVHKVAAFNDVDSDSLVADEATLIRIANLREIHTSLGNPDSDRNQLARYETKFKKAREIKLAIEIVENPEVIVSEKDEKYRQATKPFIGRFLLSPFKTDDF